MLKQVHWSRKRKSAPTQSSKLLFEFRQLGKSSSSLHGFIAFDWFWYRPPPLCDLALRDSCLDSPS
ncbi:MAG TPA: hypothetical protein VE170_15420, partial [Candidatus Limnocylindria bacterium]|nr:hypothetical protein [Candidatus Limnocylindria bacterium]